jgi:imidazolonepropionase-like amidohydrolase
LEYQLMARAGLDAKRLLATLTTNPARRFGDRAHSGRVVVGENADLVVLSGDPMQEVMSFARVRYTIRAGLIIFDAAAVSRRSTVPDTKSDRHVVTSSPRQNNAM